MITTTSEKKEGDQREMPTGQLVDDLRLMAALYGHRQYGFEQQIQQHRRNRHKYVSDMIKWRMSVADFGIAATFFCLLFLVNPDRIRCQLVDRPTPVR